MTSEPTDSTLPQHPRHPATGRTQSEELLSDVRGIAWEADAGTLQFTYVSANAENLLGYSREEWVAPGFWPAHVHPEDRSRAVEVRRRAARERRAQHDEYRVVGADGRVVWLRDIVNVVGTNDQVRKLRGIMVDITDRKQTETALREQEELYQLLTDSVSDFVCLHDLAGRSVYASPSTIRFYGSAPSEIFEPAHPDDLDVARRWWQQVVGGGKKPLNWRAHDKDGNWRWLETDASIVSYRGAPHVLTVCRDITERMRGDEERRAHLWLLESLDRVNRAIQSTNDIEQMMRDVLDTMLAVFDADQAVLVSPCDPDAAVWSIAMFRARAGFDTQLAADPILPRTPGGVQLVQAVCDTDGPVRFGPGSNHPLPDIAARRGTQSLLALRVRPKGDHPYWLGLGQGRSARVWTPHEERLFEEIGRRLADALTLLSTIHRLRESEAKLDSAQRIAHVGHWENDLAEDRLTWSDETYRILGLQPGTRAPTQSDLEDLIHPEDRELQAQATARAQAGEGRYDVEYRIIRPNGEIRTLHSVGEVVRDASGRPHHAFGVVQDITERKLADRALGESHSLLRAILDSTSDAIFIKDLQSRYALINPAGARVFGRTVEQIVGRDDWALFTPDTARAITERDEQIVASDEPQTFEETLTIGKQTRTFVTTKSPYRDARGRVQGLVGISSDVTELKALEAQFRHAQRMEAVGQLAGGVAHDFNNLLTIITAYSAMYLSELPLDTESRADMQEILAAAQRGAALTRQLLALSRRQLFQPRVLDPNQSVISMAAMLRPLVGEDITLETDLARDAWSVHTDPGQLDQVVMNLAVNARDAMPHGGTLRLATANVEIDSAMAGPQRPGLVPGQYVALTVEDTGTGIQPEILPHLFEPFFTTKGPGKGTGLGLATAYGIVKQSGGYIYVDTAPGNGSRFTVYLPRHQAEVGPAPAPIPAAAPRGTETILLVEDDAAVRAATRRLLERQGYHVREASNTHHSPSSRSSMRVTPRCPMTFGTSLPICGTCRTETAGSRWSSACRRWSTSGWTTPSTAARPRRVATQDSKYDAQCRNCDG